MYNFCCTFAENLVIMQYTVAHLAYQFTQDWQQDLFEQSMCDLGFEVFDGPNAYIQTTVLEEKRSAIEALIAESEGVSFLCWEECPDENWNAQWEAEHESIELPLGVRITPHCAFGAGHHETTSMMIEALIEAKEQGYFAQERHVLDMGCGTGVLGIMAKKCGATSVVAVDIDDKSVANSIENAEANGVAMDVRLSSIPPKGKYDLILANIHRNILIAQMPAYAEYLKPGGELWLSGFYEEDIVHLEQAAEAVGMRYVATKERGEWRWVRFTIL